MNDNEAIQVERLTREVEGFKQRLESQEGIIKQILETMKKGEELFELRASRVLCNIFKGLTHQLEHSIEDAQNALRLETQGFDIQIVDGVHVKEGPMSIVVTRHKKEDGTYLYDYAAAAEPEKVHNEGTETFNKYFDTNPTVFGDETELMVNISVYKSGE